MAGKESLRADNSATSVTEQLQQPVSHFVLRLEGDPVLGRRSTPPIRLQSLDRAAGNANAQRMARKIQEKDEWAPLLPTLPTVRKAFATQHEGLRSTTRKPSCIRRTHSFLISNALVFDFEHSSL